MKSLLARLPSRRAIGLVIEANETVLSEVAFTPLGPREVRREVRAHVDQPINPVIRELLSPYASAKKGGQVPVCVGLPTLSVFFSSRPIKGVNRDASPQVLLHEVLQSSNLNIDDMDVDMIRCQPDKQPVASIIACRKKYLSTVMEALAEGGVKPTRVEPGPCGLLRAAISRHPTPQKTRTVLRMILGQNAGLAILTACDLPLMWRGFTWLEDSLETGILSTYRATENLCRFCGLDSKIDAVIVHGGAPSGSAVWERLREALPVRLSHHDEPSCEAWHTAYGVALGCNASDAPSFNLARASAPPPPVMNLLPWGQMALQASILAGATWLLLDSAGTSQRSLTAVQAELSAHKWAKSMATPQVNERKTLLTSQVDSLKKFLEGHLLWTDCLREVSSQLPPAVHVTQLKGLCDTRKLFAKTRNTKGKESPARMLTLDVRVKTAKQGVVPPGVDLLVGALRSSEHLRGELPVIEMTNLGWNTGKQGSSPSATVTITCQPHGKDAQKTSPRSPAS